LDTVEQLEVRSDLSVVTCVDFVDTFRPEPPESLSAVASDGEVSLIWAPNDEADLAGYIVLRGLPQDETLRPLADALVTENTYRDTTAEPDTVYSYAVRAVDLALVPNLSELSNRVEEAAR
jgi:fibronectin type 3 domain-containing protein